jgi:hypothetical protein
MLMKTQQIKLLILVFFCLGLLPVRAQQAVMAAGGEATGSGGSMSYSVGQIVYTTATGTNGSANQGVQQPYEIFIVGVDENPGINLQLRVYPNPTSYQVTLDVGNLDSENLLYLLFDLRGVQLESQKIRTELTVIPLANLPAGTYIVKVLDGQSLLRTFKIIKN